MNGSLTIPRRMPATLMVSGDSIKWPIQAGCGTCGSGSQRPGPKRAISAAAQPAASDDASLLDETATAM
jgi:hypothetical protein